MENSDLETVLKLLDKIITSERKEIKNAFRELMIIAALTEPGADTAGPLMDLLARLTAVEMEVSSLRAAQNSYGNCGSIFGEPLIRGHQYSWSDSTSADIWRKFSSTAGGTFGRLNSSAACPDDIAKGAIAGGSSTLGVGSTYQSLMDSGMVEAGDITFENQDFKELWDSLKEKAEDDG